MTLGADSWSRLWKGWRSFASTICLGFEVIDHEAYEGLRDLKLWYLNHGLYNEDQALDFLKFLSKTAFQVCFEKPNIRFDGKSYFPDYDKVTESYNQSFSFFRGSLSWWAHTLINRSTLYVGLDPKSESYGSDLSSRYRALAQVSTAGRALPYPSELQVRKAVEKMISAVNKETHVSPSKISELKYALKMATSHYKEVAPASGRLDLSGAACFESSISLGGRGVYSLQGTMKLLKTQLPAGIWHSCTVDSDKFDFLGRKLGKPFNWLPLGNQIYGDDPARISDGPVYKNPWEVHIPENLGDCVALWASSEMTRYGTFLPEPQFRLPIDRSTYLPIWEVKTSRVFIPDYKALPVRAALSLEAGMKARVVTAAPAWYIQLLQVARHQIQDWFSQDPTLRVGIEEPDKLWEVLKYCQDLTDVKNIHSSDLTEATYNIVASVGDAVLDFFLEKKLSNVLSTLIQATRVWSRDVTFTSPLPVEPELRQFTAKQGSFMGEPLSFMILTGLLKAASYIAFCYDGSDYSYPDNFYEVVKPYVKSGASQSVGDDHFAVCTEKYTTTFNRVVEDYGLVRSDKDGNSPSFGVFCEQFVCIPRYPDGTPVGKPGSRDPFEFGLFEFLDVIKARVMSGDPKVQSDKSDPFLGHAKLLGKQLAWIKWPWVTERAKKLFSSIYPYQMSKISDCHADFPMDLGGLGLPVLTSHTYEQSWPKYTAYLEGMLQLPQDEFNKLYLLLNSITKGSTKGFRYDPDPKLLDKVMGLPILKESDLTPPPEWCISFEQKCRFWRDTDKVTLIEYLNDELARCTSLMNLAKGQKPEVVTQSLTIYKSKFAKVWSNIRQVVIPRDDISARKTTQRESNRLNLLAYDFRTRVRGQFVSLELVRDMICATLVVQDSRNPMVRPRDRTLESELVFSDGNDMVRALYPENAL
jgi:hypothetical protein